MRHRTAALAALALSALAIGSCLEDVSSQQPPSGVQCRLASDCKDDKAAICDPMSYTCRACRGPEDDPRCRARDPKTPVCGAAGACGSCAGSGESAVCTEADPKKPTCTAGVCGACVTAADCMSGVCQADGACAPATDVVFVDNKNGTCAAGNAHAGTPQDPMCDVLAGVTRAQMDRKGIVRVAGSKTPYAPTTVSMTGTSGVILAGVATGGEPALIRGDAPALTVLGGPARVVVTAQGLDLSSTGSDAVVCDQRTGTVMPELTLRGCRVFEAKAAGVSAIKCKLTADGVRVFNNNSGGMRLSGSAHDLSNLMIYGNSRGPGVAFDTPMAGGQLRFSTVAFNVYVGGISGIDCGAQPVDVLSSIVSGNLGGASQLRGCQLSGVVTGTEMVAGGIAKTPEFVSEKDPLDLHLKDGQASRDCCIDKVPSRAGLPARDIDGARRPQGPAWDIGAHEVSQ